MTTAGCRVQPDRPAAELVLPVLLQRQRRLPGAERLPHPRRGSQAVHPAGQHAPGRADRPGDARQVRAGVQDRGQLGGSLPLPAGTVGLSTLEHAGHHVSYIPAELAEGTPIAQPPAIPDAWPAALATYLGTQVRLACSQVTARHPNHEEAAALALPSDAAVLVREDIHQDRRGSPVDFTRTVWPGDTTRLVVGG